MTLLDKLKQATGADRELDAQVFVHLTRGFIDGKNAFDEDVYATFDSEGNSVRPGLDPLMLVPRYTASVDACLALMGEVLPDGWEVRCNFETSGWADAYAEYGDPNKGSWRHTEEWSGPAAIALLIAIVRATEDK